MENNQSPSSDSHLVSSLYGPGTVLCWLFTMMARFVVDTEQEETTIRFNKRKYLWLCSGYRLSLQGMLQTAGSIDVLNGDEAYVIRHIHHPWPCHGVV